MTKTILYIHGKGGNAEEAKHYQPMFNGCNVTGFDYASQTPWEARKEFPRFFDAVCPKEQPVEIIANSIGAFFAMYAFFDKKIERAYFISPVIDMEKLISKMMVWEHVTEAELQRRKKIPTAFGETLSWEYLCYVKEHPIRWNIPTHILYGEKDQLTSYETISGFAERIGATLTVMKGGEHWFHTERQMNFLDQWIKDLMTKE